MNFAQRLKRFWGYPVFEKTESICEFYWLLKTQIYYRRFLGHMGRGSKILSPMRLKNIRNIHIGNNVVINKYSFLLTRQIDEAIVPRLVIEDDAVIGHFNHITCVNQVCIGRKVLTADKVHIADNGHEFARTDVPIMDQGIIFRGRVAIGEGTWIGEGASILSCSIGRNCVIGANAVVVHDVPDYCVVAGIPARIIKRYEPLARRWQNRHAGREE